ncbi:MAG TPA: chromosome segregation protein SMC [Gemmatimonadaceae bacterium]|nr:chromosome segregation protein SMC [Gemmatimonadaceae bacterium]
MRLTKLELHGFKSFADSTTLTFDQGVTAIVGPNGCGKSNVSDAVRWVLGEQRARLLRGAKMEEVIFQGSSARRAVNVAEVSLHFDNTDGGLPVAFREVVITRRLSRSGESDYLLNGAPCRLRDIHDLLRGTGLGADTGVVIESKMIDALLSDRPDDRRELFEEAAGVGLYRDRRRTTERRLEETTVDLQRLDDLIAEVTTQVRSLARQRRRAERYAELSARRFTVEIALAAREMAAWHDELGRLGARVAELRDQLPDAEARAAAAEQARDAAHGARATAEAQRNELSRLVTEQRERAQHIRGEMAVAEERQRNAQLRRERAESEASHGQLTRARLTEERDRAAVERAELDSALGALETELAERQRREDASREAVGAARAAAETAERALRDVQDRVRRLEIDRERAQRELDETTQRSAVLDGERAALTDAFGLAQRDLEAATAALDAARAQSTAANDALEQARQHDRETRERDAEARAALTRVEQSFTALQGKVHALEGLERERVGLAPAAARLLKERDQFGAGAVLGPLSDFLSADQASAMLIERFLGATVHAVLVRDRQAAEAVRRWHQQANPGPLLLLPVDATPGSAGEPTLDDALATGVEAATPAQAWVRSLLGRVRSESEGTAFVDGRGAVWLPGATGGPGPLRRRAELFALRAELAASEEARRAAAAAVETTHGALQMAERRVTETANAAALGLQQVGKAAERHADSSRVVQRTERDLQDSAELAGRLVRRCDELRATIAAFDTETAGLRTGLAERDADIIQARAALAESEAEQERAREQRTAWQVEQAQVQARAQVAADREQRLSEELRSASERLESLSAELGGLSDSDAALAEQMAAWRADLDARLAALHDGEQRLGAAEQGVAATDTALTAAEHALDRARHDGSAMADELHHAELRFAELSGRRAAIRERLETEWRKPLDEMIAGAEPLDMDDPTLRAEADDLRQQLEQLGPVNALAIEEHDETVHRLEFLTTQRADLNEAKNSLAQAIREIDLTARDMFLQTFVQVRENFRQIFMTLFGGGECDLRLENPEAPLDCDIEIHASPRGKRTQRIHLLSSGERALVALSLLFGIFLTKPSPFCLLDEVDAPLDDANIGRFVRMLTEFKQKTQFIVITHNPRTTTEAADAVYGVTMQEPGVSSLVSVRMKGAPVDERPMAEAAETAATA